MARCPFHEDRHPSLVVFGNGWKCFGCQEHGDGVDLVARLYNLRPIDAARTIARDFGLHVDVSQPISTDARRKIEQARKKAARRRQLEKAFSRKVEEVYLQLAIVRRFVLNLKTFVEYEQVADLVHAEPYLEYLQSELQSRDITRQVEAVRAAERWF
ncbi:MAG: DNA primase [Pelotomaculum sp. PtaU1.Bin035]|nr:MAG: DNA primase [Pelotomaculum sp. PtaU1.Bin035]